MLAEGCIRLGLIENEEEIGTYYMHSVSHHLGIDVHDVNTLENDKLLPGMVISDEPDFTSTNGKSASESRTTF